MAITDNHTHDLCAMWIAYHPEKTHTASLICKEHGKWIQWLSREDMQCLLDQGLAEIRPRRYNMISEDDLGI